MRDSDVAGERSGEHLETARRDLRPIMKKLVGLLVIIGVVVVARRFAPYLRARGLEVCERMFDGMPDAFPPKRMMANLEIIRAQNERIIELLGESSRLPPL